MMHVAKENNIFNSNGNISGNHIFLPMYDKEKTIRKRFPLTTFQWIEYGERHGKQMKSISGIFVIDVDLSSTLYIDNK